MTEKTLWIILEKPIFGVLLCYSSLIKQCTDKVSPKIRHIKAQQIEFMVEKYSVGQRLVHVSVADFALRAVGDQDSDVHKSAINLARAVQQREGKQRLDSFLMDSSGVKASIAEKNCLIDPFFHFFKNTVFFIKLYLAHSFFFSYALLHRYPMQFIIVIESNYFRNKFAINKLILLLSPMDLTEAFQPPMQDFFEESRINNLVLPLETSAHKYYEEEEIFRFVQERESQPQPQIQSQPQPHIQDPPHGDIDEGSIGRHLSISAIDSNPIDKLLSKYEQEEDDLIQGLQAPTAKVEETDDAVQECIDTPAMQSLITLLVECPYSSEGQLRESVALRFPHYSHLSVVQVLIQKFGKLKKTKEQLIKYCMRKAFKFILELPRNMAFCQGLDKKQKCSFSKCKNKYLKRVSEQKSMNSKFLQQIFSEGDFKRDYFIFLSHFEEIMLEDNDRKIAYLAELLTNHKDGKTKNAEMVKRLPWTRPILDKVQKISKELLRFAEPLLPSQQ